MIYKTLSKFGLVQVRFVEEVGKENKVRGVHRQGQIYVFPSQCTWHVHGFNIQRVDIDGDPDNHLTQLETSDHHGPVPRNLHFQ